VEKEEAASVSAPGSMLDYIIDCVGVGGVDIGGETVVMSTIPTGSTTSNGTAASDIITSRSSSSSTIPIRRASITLRVRQGRIRLLIGRRPQWAGGGGGEWGNERGRGAGQEIATITKPTRRVLVRVGRAPRAGTRRVGRWFGVGAAKGGR
jgi:hypothetical protein